MFVAEAPIARLSNTESKLFKTLSKHWNIIEIFLIDVLKLYNLILPNWIESELTAIFCEHFLEVCEGVIELVADEDPSVDNFARIKTFMTHFPAGAGYRNTVHYAQSMSSGTFARYDYGRVTNRQKYG